MSHHERHPQMMDSINELSRQDFLQWSYILHYVQSDEPWKYPEHQHQGYFEWVYVMSGEVDHWVAKQKFSLKSGDLLVLGEQVHHEIRGQDFSFANLMIPVDVWHEVMDFLFYDDPFGDVRSCTGAVTTLPFGAREPFRMSLEFLFRRQQSQEGERYFRRFLMELLLGEDWFFSTKKPAPPGIPGWWTDLERQVDELEHLPSGAKELADWAARSREHVSRTCQKSTGLSPSSWLNQKRVERAALMLKKTNRSVTEIAELSGFGNLSHFYRLFRQAHGLPPRAYRQQHGEAPAVR